MEPKMETFWRELEGAPEEAKWNLKWRPFGAPWNRSICMGNCRKMGAKWEGKWDDLEFLV